jgi:hypothetical protein
MNGSGSGCGGTGQAGGVDGTTRVVYFDGQRLEADDLNSAADQMRQLRWLHNRSLHSPGVGLGFGATGNAGDRQVTVPPGYAVDCLGRELVLTTTITLPVPARSGDAQGNPVSYALVAAYPDDSQLAVIQSRAADCGGTSGAVRLQEQALIYWRQPPICSQEILLAMATIQNCQLTQALAVDQTRRARPITTPFVASGESDLGSTPWQPWPSVAAQGQTGLIGIQATIDTCIGRFSATPTYQAQLRGPRFFNSVQGNTNPPFLLDGTLVVCDAAPASFTAYVLLPRILRQLSGLLNPATLFENVTGGQDALISLVTSNWTVAWIGVED